MGFCYVVGFGTANDHKKAIDIIGEAASNCLWKARVILKRVAAALAQPLEIQLQASVDGWLRDGSKMGSIAARGCMRNLAPD